MLFVLHIIEPEREDVVLDNIEHLGFHISRYIIHIYIRGLLLSNRYAYAIATAGKRFLHSDIGSGIGTLFDVISLSDIDMPG